MAAKGVSHASHRPTRTPGGLPITYDKNGVPTVGIPKKKAPSHTKAPGGHSPAILASHATLRAFDAGTYLAVVQLTKSPDTTIAGVPVSKAILAGDLVAGKTVALIVFDHLNVADSMIVGVGA